MKVIIALAVVAVLAGLGTNWARHRGEDLLHRAVDTSLPGKVEAHPWSPLSHGTPRRADRVTFLNGVVSTTRCQTVLGHYSVRVDHDFSFDRAETRVRPGCPGRKLQAELAKATRVDVEAHGGSERLVFSHDDHTDVQLQGRGA
jgi:hypothetical protein